MRELLEYLVGALVDKPEAVKVEEFEEDDGTLVFELSVDDDDYGRVIGRGGRTAQALRTVVKAAAVKDNRRVLVEKNFRTKGEIPLVHARIKGDESLRFTKSETFLFCGMGKGDPGGKNGKKKKSEYRFFCAHEQ